MYAIGGRGTLKEIDMEEDKEKKSVKRSDWDIRPYLAIGALIFLVFCCCIAVWCGHGLAACRGRAACHEV